MVNENHKTPRRKRRRVLIREMEDDNICCKIKNLSAKTPPLFDAGLSVPSGSIINGHRKHLVQESLSNNDVTPHWNNHFKSYKKCVLQITPLPSKITLQEDGVKKTFIKVMNGQDIYEIEDASSHDPLSTKILSSTHSRREFAAEGHSKPTSLPHESWNEHGKTIRKEKGRDKPEFKENSGQLCLTPEKGPKSLNKVSPARPEYLPAISPEIGNADTPPLSDSTTWKCARTIVRKVGRRNHNSKTDNISTDLSTSSKASLSTPALLKSNSKSIRNCKTKCALRKTSDYRNLLNDGRQLHSPYFLRKSLLKCRNTPRSSRGSCVILNHEFLKPVGERRYNKRAAIFPRFGTLNIQAFLQDKTYQPRVILVNCRKGYCFEPEFVKPPEKKSQFKGQTSSHDLSVSNNHVLAQDNAYQPYVLLDDCLKEDNFKTKSQVSPSLGKKQLGEKSKASLIVSKEEPVSFIKTYQPYVYLVDCIEEEDFKTKSQVSMSLGKEQFGEKSKASLIAPKDEPFSFMKTYQPYVCLVDCIEENDLKTKSHVVTPIEKENLRETSKASFSTTEDDAVYCNKTYQPHVCPLDFRKEQTSAISAEDQVNGFSVPSEDCKTVLERNTGYSCQNEESNERIPPRDEAFVSETLIKQELLDSESTYDFETKYTPFSRNGYQDAFLFFLSNETQQPFGGFTDTNSDAICPKTECFTE